MPSYREILKRDVKKTGTRFGVCGCLERPLFLKALSWRESFCDGWRELAESRQRYSALHQHPNLLSPILHIRTPNEWIRVYQHWPTDLGTLFVLGGTAELPWSTAKKIAVSIIDGLVALENADWIHRDLKASNVLVSADGELRVVLSDYGDFETTGTPYWAAPELKEKNPNRWTPVFGLGLILWELLSSRSFKKMVRDYHNSLNESAPIWPEGAREYLEIRFIEDTHKLALHQRSFPGDREQEMILSFIRAAVVHDVAEREKRIADLLGASDRPMAAIRAWFNR